MKAMWTIDGAVSSVYKEVHPWGYSKLPVLPQQGVMTCFPAVPRLGNADDWWILLHLAVKIFYKISCLHTAVIETQ